MDLLERQQEPVSQHPLSPVRWSQLLWVVADAACTEPATSWRQPVVRLFPAIQLSLVAASTSRTAGASPCLPSQPGERLSSMHAGFLVVHRRELCVVQTSSYAIRHLGSGPQMRSAETRGAGGAQLLTSGTIAFLNSLSSLLLSTAKRKVPNGFHFDCLCVPC